VEQNTKAAAEIIVRRALPHDADAIAEIQVASWRATYDKIIPASFLEAMNSEEKCAIWRNGIVEQRTNAWVVEQDHKVVGFAAIGKTRDEDVEVDPIIAGELYAIYVVPSMVGSGLGRRLLEATLADLVSMGFSQCLVWVLVKNISARRFYEAAGFTDDTKVEPQIYDNETLEKMRYRRSINL